LQDELIAVNPDRVRCFLDAYSIRSGEEWHSKIIANLKAADWLVFLYTGRERRPYDFCGFEIGIFTSVHSLDTSRKITEAARLLCIHDTPAVPSLLSMVQNRRLRPYQPDGPLETTKEFDFYVDSPLAQFFEDFYQYPANSPLRRMLKRIPGGGSQLREMPNIATEIADRVKRLTIKFQEARKNDPISEKFYQVRMEIDVRDPLPKNKNNIPGRSTVTAMQDTFNLLGLSPDPDESGQLKTTWEQIKNSLEANNETFAWMDKVEDDILDAAHQRNLEVRRSPSAPTTVNFTGLSWHDRLSMAAVHENSRLYSYEPCQEVRRRRNHLGIVDRVDFGVEISLHVYRRGSRADGEARRGRNRCRVPARLPSIDLRYRAYGA
jgi:hypothetical protein